MIDAEDAGVQRGAARQNGLIAADDSAVAGLIGALIADLREIGVDQCLRGGVEQPGRNRDEADGSRAAVGVVGDFLRGHLREDGVGTAGPSSESIAEKLPVYRSGWATVFD